MDDRNAFDDAIEACEALEELLCDEHRPGGGLCIICFSCIPQLLKLDGPDIVRLRTRHHDLWDACMRSLTVPRSGSQNAALRQRLQDNINNCSRRLPGDPHEELSVFFVSDPLQQFRMLLCNCLSNCLYGVDHSSGNLATVVKRANNPHKRFCSASRAWPTRISQLFPYGPERTVAALIDACCAFTDTGALWILNAVLRLARPLIWDAILQPDNCLRLTWFITATLLLSLSSDPTHTAKIAALAPPGCSPPSDIAEAEWLRAGEEADAIIAFLGTVRVGPYSHPDDPERFATACGELVTGRLRYAFRVAAEYHKPTMYRRWLAFQQYIVRLGTHAVARTRVPYSDLIAHIQCNPRDRTILSIVRLALNLLPLHRRCAGAGCTRTMFDLEEEGKPLSTCGKCKLFCYCCRECQRADWRTGHKQLCPIFVALLDAAPPLLPPDEFLRAIHESAISDADLLELGMWALGRGQHMRDLLACELAFPHLTNAAPVTPQNEPHQAAGT
ncbi:hypothetical protein AURDEDRAFT_173773 [Auricularia subglabra TFB-10046 SS5]|nr:hypothetical protein AURDEDRAFT_173773 [Auricularia subglabra TFB-10046 SS5]